MNTCARCGIADDRVTYQLGGRLPWYHDTGPEVCIAALLGKLAAHEQRKCPTCRHEILPNDPLVVARCNLISTWTRGKYPLLCKDVRFCGAWEAK